MIKSKSAIRASIIANIVLIIFALFAVLPFILLIISSLTDNQVAMVEGYSFFPSKLSLSAYKYLLDQWQMIGRGYFMTILVTVLGTTLSIVITSSFAYALSVPGLPGRQILMMMVIISMLFNGGIVASYYVYANFIHIKDTIWALIVPGFLMSAFNVILIRNYYVNNISGEILESARLDGAGEIRIFLRIVVPLSVPIYATIGLMSAVMYWNEWTNGLYYLTQRNGSHLYTIQMILNQINENISFMASNAAQLGITVDQSEMPSTTIRMAIAVVAIFPIVASFPFFQKYFVKGISIGGVKG
ncbi:MAG: carbohydrate ABC transporter permease [Acutalibacter sp.]|nr:carbohydrate ABC transporter permease [Acutalibacter sp.]